MLSKALKEVRLELWVMMSIKMKKGVFFKDHSQDLPEDDLLLRLNAMTNALITAHHAFLTKEALTNIADTTVYNLNCWDSGMETENELTELVEIV
ncbi:hypothetical protein [Psychroserpens jangbogonensis]|uniref:hypothetical protein n=1 Tax=Psychroserpens jangbogonensis TaxID=1484460 RepID=UPI00053E4E5D|nr:hypothetical protein [Psychroserpens jangbogonensis]